MTIKPSNRAVLSGCRGVTAIEVDFDARTIALDGPSDEFFVETFDERAGLLLKPVTHGTRKPISG